MGGLVNISLNFKYTEINQLCFN